MTSQWPPSSREGCSHAPCGRTSLPGGARLLGGERQSWYPFPNPPHPTARVPALLRRTLTLLSSIDIQGGRYQVVEHPRHGADVIAR